MRSSVDCSRLAEAMSARRDGSRMASRICPVSSGMSGDSAITFLQVSRTASASPSASGEIGAGLLDGMHVGHEVRRDLREDAEAAPLEPADDDGDAGVGELDHLEDLGFDADGVQILGRRLFDLRILLRRDHDARRLAAHDVVDQLERACATDVDGQDHAGEQDEVAQRQDGQRLHGRLDGARS